jgi:putative SOS response-associated peptidase YedK
MTDLYAVTISPAAMLELFSAKHDRTGNLPPNLAVLPGAAVPVVRKDTDGERAIELMRWGLPNPEGKGGNPLATIADIGDARWRDCLGPDQRCLVPANAFSERHDAGSEPHWFARDESRTPFAFAGIWMPAKGGHTFFAILTTEANALVRPIHAEGMPVVLGEDDWEIWLAGDADAARALLRPAPEDLLHIVATGEERDPPESRMGYQ